MDQIIIVYGFCILAALILMGMLVRFHSATKAWEKQIQSLKNSMQETKEYHDILIIDMKCLLSDQEEISLHLKDSFQNMAETAKGICNQIQKLAQEAVCQEEDLGTIKNEIETLNDETKSLTETTADVLQKAQDTESCSQSVKDAYREFLEKHRERKASVNQVRQQADLIDRLMEEFPELVRWISDFAEQIELLSLNVNIEAAKVKEQENGFSVIALEMKKLSEEGKEISDAFVKKSSALYEYTQQNKDSINNMMKLQETEQAKITKTGLLLEQMNQDTQKVIQAVRQSVDGIEEFETDRQKILEMFENLQTVKNRGEEGQTEPEKLQDMLAKAAEDSSVLARITEEMQIRITQ